MEPIISEVLEANTTTLDTVKAQVIGDIFVSWPFIAFIAVFSTL